MKVRIIKDVPGTAGAVRWAKDALLEMSDASAQKWIDAGFAEQYVEPEGQVEGA